MEQEKSKVEYHTVKVENDPAWKYFVVLIVAVALFSGEPDLVDSFSGWLRGQTQQCVEVRNESK